MPLPPLTVFSCRLQEVGRVSVSILFDLRDEAVGKVTGNVSGSSHAKQDERLVASFLAQPGRAAVFLTFS